MLLQMEHTFDKTTYRHKYNGTTMVMHCHHYMSLLTQLAMEFADVHGTDILSSAAEDSLRPVIEESAKRQGLSSPQDILTIGRELYQQLGMGLMSVTGNEAGGEVTLLRSHVDQGWTKKWGKASIPVNFFTRGFVAAMFCVAYGKPANSYKVDEVQSMAKGDAATSFTVKPK
jgi:hypothetical protein